MPPEEIKAIIRRWVDEPWNKGNVGALDELCAPEYAIHNGTETGRREKLKQGIADARTQSPDLRTTTTDVIPEGDKAAVEKVPPGGGIQRSQKE